MAVVRKYEVFRKWPFQNEYKYIATTFAKSRQDAIQKYLSGMVLGEARYSFSKRDGGKKFDYYHTTEDASVRYTATLADK